MPFDRERSPSSAADTFRHRENYDERDMDLCDGTGQWRSPDGYSFLVRCDKPHQHGTILCEFSGRTTIQPIDQPHAHGIQIWRPLALALATAGEAAIKEAKHPPRWRPAPKPPMAPQPPQAIAQIAARMESQLRPSAAVADKDLPF